MTAFLAAVWQVFLELSPWMLLGTVIAGVLHVLIPEGWINQRFQGRKGVLQAVLFGVPLPLCSCGVIPTAIGLKKQGASNGSALSFLISTPQTGVDSILVAATFLGWPFALLKVIAAGMLGIVGGLLADEKIRDASANGTNDSKRSADASKPNAQPAAPQLHVIDLGSPKETSDAPPQDSASHRKGIRAGVNHGLEIIGSIWGWLVIGVLLSAALTVWVPPDAFSGLTGYGILVALVAMLAISLPLYVCATASVPIAAALVAAGFPPGAALVFLMAGPATNVATIGAVYKQFGWKNLLVYLSVIVVGSIAVAVGFNGLLSADVARTAMAHHHHGGQWWQVASAVVLVGLLVYFALQDTLRFYRHTIAPPQQDKADLTLHVDGMVCKNCAQNVENTVRKLPGVSAAQVNLELEQLEVFGSTDANSVRTAVQNAGFQCS